MFSILSYFSHETAFFKCLHVCVGKSKHRLNQIWSKSNTVFLFFWQGILLLTFSPSNSPMKMHSCLYQVGIMQWTCLAVAYKLGIMIEACIRKVHWLTCDLLKPLGEWWRNLFLKLFPFKIMATFCTSRYKISSYRFLCPPSLTYFKGTLHFFLK